MIDCLTNPGAQYFYGTWFKDIHSHEGKEFQYELLDTPRKSYGSVINNLIMTQETMTIKTCWDFGFEPKQVIVDNYGERWKINTVLKMPQTINPQVLHIALSPETEFVLSLIKISSL